MATVRELLQSAAVLPVDTARRDAEILLCHCLEKPRAWLYSWPEQAVSDDAAGRFRRLLAARASGEPIAYLTGLREFWSLPLAVNRHTLIPRPETETLVEWALSLSLPSSAVALDLGTGSGAIALALAHERPAWTVIAADASAEALAVARVNAARLGLDSVRFLRSDWYQGIDETCFDLVVSNPPYVAPDDPHLGEGDLRFEPSAALVAAEQGLADLRVLVEGGRPWLRAGGWLLLEHGCEQGPAVRSMLREAGFGQVLTRCDIAGLERVSGGCLDA
jgi:release factor glutamine methyltransferase